MKIDCANVCFIILMACLLYQLDIIEWHALPND